MSKEEVEELVAVAHRFLEVVVVIDCKFLQFATKKHTNREVAVADQHISSDVSLPHAVPRLDHFSNTVLFCILH